MYAKFIFLKKIGERISGGKFFLFSFLLRHCDIFGEKTWWDKVQDKDRSLAWRILVAGKIKQG